MLKKLFSSLTALALVLTCAACNVAAGAATAETVITLSSSGVQVDGKAAPTTASSAVYTGAGIVYYKSGTDATYGEGTAADGHTAPEAAGHTVVTITKAGTYRVTGTLAAGQLAVDLGDDAKSDPNAVVTLILDNADITCTVAPAVIFYNVYECGSADTATATATVDTAKAGANVLIADGSVNDISGSYVAKIYKEGTDKKLHKYDGAFCSKMSMNVTSGSQGTGVLNITAENEGLGSELHLTVNGGVINITAQNDGINTNEDGVSVTTINGGIVTLNAGLGAEGDGIDSNGFLVINGGTVTALANGKSGDGGLDADMGIYLNGGTVISTGSMNDAIAATSTQNYMELSFSGSVPAGARVVIQDPSGTALFDYITVKAFSASIFSSPKLTLDTTYAVYVDGVQQQYTGTGSGRGGGGFGGGQKPDGTTIPEGMTPPDDSTRPQRPEGDSGTTPPEGFDKGQGGGRPDGGDGGTSATASTAFTLTADARSFSGVSAASGLPFTDVTAGSAQYAAIQTLYAKGVMNGTGAATFSPDATVSRAMAVTVLARLAQATAADTGDFSDVANGSWYSGYVGWAVTSGIVLGDGQGRFMPDDGVTAAQMELILSRYATLSGIDYTASNGSDKALTRGELAQMLVKVV